jgi:hypothetical protein
VQQQALADFAGQIAALEYRADGSAAQFVELFGNGAELAAFADGDHQSGGFQRFWANAFYNQFHVRVPELMVNTQELDGMHSSLLINRKTQVTARDKGRSLNLVPRA